MAGVNQHNIPQALLRGFRIPRGSKKHSETWLYEKGGAPRVALIKREVAAGAHFYSVPSDDGSKTLDDLFTEYETEFGKRLRTLKEAPIGTPVNAEIIAETVAHLTIRNAHVRKTFSMGAESLFGRAVDLFNDEDNLRRLFGVDEPSPPDVIKRVVDKGIEKAESTGNTINIPRQVLYRIAHMLTKEKFNTFFLGNVRLMTRALSVMGVGGSAPSIRDGHNRLLSSESFGAGVRAKLLGSLVWSVRSAPEGGFILPDCVALADDDGTGLKPLILANLDRTTAVVMPLSASAAVVGVRDSSVQPELAFFNKAAATCSQEFFVAARAGADLESFIPLIGTSSDQAIKLALDEAFEKFDARLGKAGTATGAGELIAEESSHTEVSPETAEATSHDLQYSVTFLGCADQEAADKIASVVSSVTAALNGVLALGRLDGVTFAADYPAALRDLDRGFQTSVPLQPTETEYAVGVGMAPTVLRDGVPKTHIVMRSDIGFALIEEKEKNSRDHALNVLVGLLAHAACTQIFDESLPGLLLRRVEDPFDGFLFQHVDEAWRGYFASRVSASFGEEIGVRYCEILCSVLRKAQTEIPAARLRYRFDGDLDVLLSIALPLIEQILKYSSSTAGHFKSLNQRALNQPELGSVLELLELKDWFVLFSAELSELWDRRGKWESFDEFLAFGRHVERLLWQFGLIPWKKEDGGIWIEVPLGTDAERLASTPS